MKAEQLDTAQSASNIIGEVNQYAEDVKAFCDSRGLDKHGLTWIACDLRELQKEENKALRREFMSIGATANPDNLPKWGILAAPDAFGGGIHVSCSFSEKLRSAYAGSYTERTSKLIVATLAKMFVAQQGKLSVVRYGYPQGANYSHIVCITPNDRWIIEHKYGRNYSEYSLAKQVPEIK